MSKIVRKFSRDGAWLPLAKRARDASGGPARRTLVCSFEGSAYSAEREDSTLKIYLTTNDPVSTSLVGDTGREPTTLADLQAMHEAKFPRQKGYAR